MTPLLSQEKQNEEKNVDLNINDKVDTQTEQVNTGKKVDSSSDIDIHVNSNLLKEWEQFDQQIKGQNDFQKLSTTQT